MCLPALVLDMMNRFMIGFNELMVMGFVNFLVVDVMGFMNFLVVVVMVQMVVFLMMGF